MSDVRRMPRGTPGLLRSINDRSTLSVLIEHGPLTRARICDLTGLSKPTVSQVVARLEDAQLVEPAGAVAMTRGPAAVLYAVRRDRVRGVAVDVRPHRALATVVDIAGTEYPVADLALGTSADGRSAVGDVRAACEAACEAAGVSLSGVMTVVVGVQGAVDPEVDRLAFLAALPGWQLDAAHATLREGIGAPTVLENDVNLAAGAERYEGRMCEADDFALLWLGDGIGVAAQLGDELRRGARGGAGEIGYLPVPLGAELLDPRARDLQDLLGGRAVAEIARRHGGRGEGLEDLLASVAGTAGWPAMLAELADRIAAGVLPVLAVLDPEVLVLGGPVGLAGGDQLAELVEARVWAGSRWRTTVAATSVAARPVLRGARRAAIAALRETLLDAVGDR